MPRPNISDETFREVADLERSRKYAEHYEAIENALISLAENLWLVTDDKDTQLEVTTEGHMIICRVRYRDGGCKEWREEIDWWWGD